MVRDIIAVATELLARNTDADTGRQFDTTASLCGATDHGSSLDNEPISGTSVDATDAAVDATDAAVDATDASVDATNASVHDAISRPSRNADTINDDNITGGCTDLTT